MATDSQQLRDRLLRTYEEFRQLITKHQELDTRLYQLSHQSYLSGPEEVEQVTLKKRKLQVKDQMEDILRLHRNVGVQSMVDAPRPAIS